MNPTAQIQAVTFDIGGTLIEPWPSVGHVYAEVAARRGVPNVTPELLNARFKAAWRARASMNDTRADWAELVDETFRGLAASPPSETFFPELYARFAQPEAWHLFEDVRPALDALAAQGIRLGVISNWDERLRELLHRLGLMNYFEALVISCEAGCAKPAPAIFAEAAQKLELPPASILHVGDSPEMDVAGAQAAGFRALRILRHRGADGAGGLKSLLELTEIVRHNN